MQRYHAATLCIACSLAGILAISSDSVSAPDWEWLVPESLSVRESSYAAVPGEEHGHSVEFILDIKPYDDLDYGFSVAIPAGWHRIVTADPDQSSQTYPASEPVQNDGSVSGDLLQTLEPGYAVGFESSRQHVEDRFADYILVEILPGNASGLFAADVEQRQSVLIDGRLAWYDRLEIREAQTGLTDVDLVIYQAELAGVGYTVGLYAIGEHTNERIMATAFEIMLQTFRVNRPPFSIS